MDIPAVIDYVIVQTSRGKSKSDYLKSFTGLIDVNLNSFSDILTQINQGTILATEATPKRQPCIFKFSWEATLKIAFGRATSKFSKIHPRSHISTKLWA